MTLKEYLDANSEVTRADFAKRIGVSEAALSMYVSNKRFPKAFTLIQIERETQNQVTASDMAMDHYQ
jgi:predicted transcriptional regulator